MPRRALRPCTHPGCGVLVARGKCETHRTVERQAYDRQRGKTVERGYDAAWKRVRAAFLEQHPLCECDDCKGGVLQVTPADVVDHIQPIETHPDLRLAWNNLRSMSKAHHDAHTARTRGYGRARR